MQIDAGKMCSGTAMRKAPKGAFSTIGQMVPKEIGGIPSR